VFRIRVDHNVFKGIFVVLLFGNRWRWRGCSISYDWRLQQWL